MNTLGQGNDEHSENNCDVAIVPHNLTKKFQTHIGK